MESVPRNVFRVCPDEVQSPTVARRVEAPDEYKIFRRSTGEVLRICRGQITVSDLIKAAKCARYDGEFRAYNGQMGGTNNIMKSSDFPARRNVYITRARKEAVPRSGGTRVFSVCESTSTPPARQPTHVVAPAPERNTGKKKILRKAIEALKIATSALEELSGTF